jgi:hypothetical protein
MKERAILFQHCVTTPVFPISMHSEWHPPLCANSNGLPLNTQIHKLEAATHLTWPSASALPASLVMTDRSSHHRSRVQIGADWPTELSGGGCLVTLRQLLTATFPNNLSPCPHETSLLLTDFEENGYKNRNFTRKDDHCCNQTEITILLILMTVGVIVNHTACQCCQCTKVKKEMCKIARLFVSFVRTPVICHRFRPMYHKIRSLFLTADTSQCSVLLMKLMERHSEDTNGSWRWWNLALHNSGMFLDQDLYNHSMTH